MPWDQDFISNVIKEFVAALEEAAKKYLPQPSPTPNPSPGPDPSPVPVPVPPTPADLHEGKYFTRINLGKMAGGGFLKKSLGDGWYDAEVYFEWNEPYFLPCRVNVNEVGEWFYSNSLAEARYIIDSNKDYWYS